MNKVLLAMLVVFGLAVAGFFGWALFATQRLGSWTGGSWVLGLIIGGCVLVTGALAGGFMWLAFYSARKGYDDDQATFDPWKKP